MTGQDFQDVESFCLFVGYTRSGHSIVGTLLDAHPEAAIAHEQPLFSPSMRAPTTGSVQHRTRDLLFAKLLQDTHYRVELGRRGSRRTADNPMPLVPGGSHGTTTRLRVIGTKRGQEAPVAWKMNHAILDELRDFVGVPLRLLHVYRNPWDNVASMMRQSPDRAIVRYFSRVRAIREIKATGVPVHDLALEDLIARPRRRSRRCCGSAASRLTTPGWTRVPRSSTPSRTPAGASTSGPNMRSRP